MFYQGYFDHYKNTKNQFSSTSSVKSKQEFVLKSTKKIILAKSWWSITLDKDVIPDMDVLQ